MNMEEFKKSIDEAFQLVGVTTIWTNKSAPVFHANLCTKMEFNGKTYGYMRGCDVVDRILFYVQRPYFQGKPFTPVAILLDAHCDVDQETWVFWRWLKPDNDPELKQVVVDQ